MGKQPFGRRGSDLLEYGSHAAVRRKHGLRTPDKHQAPVLLRRSLEDWIVTSREIIPPRRTSGTAGLGSHPDPCGNGGIHGEVA